MATPRKFAAGFVLGLALTVCVFYCLFTLQLGAPTGSSQWSWAINAKKRTLAEAAGSPKLLLVGGSATLFGLSAQTIQTRTGFPTVNMGTHAALGSEYILHLIRQSARPGDILLLAFEYEVYSEPYRDELFYDYLLARDPDYFRAMPLAERLETAMFISSTRLKRGLRSRGKLSEPPYTFPYDPKQINEFGDLFGTTADRRPAGRPYLARMSGNLLGELPPHSKGFEILSDFIWWARQHNIRVLATFPPICHRAEYAKPAGRRAIHQIEAFYASLGVPVLGTAEESMLPPELFFDTLYHPTEEGARERTRRLLPHLSPFLKAPPDSQPAGKPAQ